MKHFVFCVSVSVFRGIEWQQNNDDVFANLMLAFVPIKKNMNE